MYMNASVDHTVVLPVGTLVTASATYRVGEDGVTSIAEHSSGFAVVKGEDITDFAKIDEVRAVYRYPAD